MGMAAATADTQANGDLPISALLCSFGHPCVRPVHLPLICTQETYMNSEKQSGLRQYKLFATLRYSEHAWTTAITFHFHI